MARIIDSIPGLGVICSSELAGVMEKIPGYGNFLLKIPAGCSKFDLHLQRPVYDKKWSQSTSIIK